MSRLVISRDALITDNFFDSPTVNGSSTALTLFNGPNWVYTRNYNQTEFLFLFNQQGEWIDGGTGQIKASLDITNLDIDIGFGNISNTHTNLVANAAVGSSNLDWTIAMEGIIPFQAHVVAVTLNATKASANVSGGTGTFTLFQGGVGGTSEVGTPTWNFGTQGTGTTITSTITTPDKTYKTGTGMVLALEISSLTYSAAGNLNFSPVIITYRW